MDADAGINTDEGTKPFEKIIPYADIGLLRCCCLLGKRFYGLVRQGINFFDIRPPDDEKLELFFHFGKTPLYSVIIEMINVVPFAPPYGIPQSDECSGTDVIQDIIITEEIIKPDRRFADIHRHKIMRLVKPGFAERLLRSTGIFRRFRLLWRFRFGFRLRRGIGFVLPLFADRSRLGRAGVCFRTNDCVVLRKRVLNRLFGRFGAHVLKSGEEKDEDEEYGDCEISQMTWNDQCVMFGSDILPPKPSHFLRRNLSYHSINLDNDEVSALPKNRH